MRILGGIVNKVFFLSGFLFLSLISTSVSANLRVKIDLKHIASDKVISSEVETKFNSDVTYIDQNTQRKYVFRISPVRTLKVNGQDINPIQFDMKVYDAKEKLLSRPQTVTTFYRPEANFSLASKENIRQLDTGIKVTILQ